MILFHGTNTDFQQIRLDMSRVGKDFGYGFYLTTDKQVAIGPIADDTVGFQIRRYTEGIITKSQFLEEIKYHHVTMQYFFGTERALTLLERR